MKKKIMITLISLLTGVALTGCADKKEEGLEQIKNGFLTECPAYSINDLVNNYMVNPAWTEEKSDKSYTVYNVTGGITYNGKEATALIQFAIDKNDIIVKSFEIDKESKKADSYNALVNDMCKSMEHSDRDDKVTIKNYVGKNYIEAKAELESYGLNVNISGEESSDYVENQVIRQSVLEGETLSVGDSITLYIAVSKSN